MNGHLCLKTILPFDKSYADICIVTVSPVRIRIRFCRILPLITAMIVWSSVSLTRNKVDGRHSSTTPSNSNTSDLAT